MSFLSDLFEGNFSNLGTDISNAPSSAVQDYRSEWVPAAAIAGTALTAGLLGPELLPAAAADVAATDVGAGLTAAAADPALEASIVADPALTATAVDPALTASIAGDTGLSATALDPALTASVVDPASLTATAVDPSLSASIVPDTVASGWGDYVAPGIQASDFSPSYGMTDFYNPGQFSPNDLSNLTGLTPDETSAFISPSGQVDWQGLSAAESSANVAPAAPGATATPTAGGWTPSAAETPGITGQTGLSQANSMFGKFEAPTSWFGPDSVTGLGGWQAAGLGLAAAPLALALLRGEQSLPPQATQAQQNANQLSAFGAQQLAAGQSGQLNAGQMAMVTQLGQNELNAYRQQLYNMGVKDPSRDTRYAQMQAQVLQDQAVLTQNLLQQDIQNGLNAMGAASGTLTTVAQMQMTADQNFTNNLVNATTALGKVAGTGMMNPNFAGGPGTKTTTTTTVQQAA